MSTTQANIVFFTSGQFAMPTLRRLKTCGYNIVGIVTSNESKGRKKVQTAKDFAIEHNIPYQTVRKSSEMSDETFKDWLKGLSPDIFCVISFKYIPSDVLPIAKLGSFNVHASLLPFLRGAAPINWALRLDFRETGVTSITLDKNIDQGNIIAAAKTRIDDDDNYGTLFDRLSEMCCNVTELTIKTITENGDYLLHTIPQSTEFQYESMFNAPKITDAYFDVTTPLELKSVLRSVYPNDGIKCKAYIYNRETGNKEREFKVKVFDLHLVGPRINPNIDENKDLVTCGDCLSNGKTFFYFRDSTTDCCWSIQELQVEGRNKMPIKEFLKGFYYLRQPTKYTVLFDIDNTINYSVQRRFKERLMFHDFNVYKDYLRGFLDENVSDSVKSFMDTFDVTNKELEDNEEYFLKMFREHISAFKALEFYTFERYKNGKQSN